MYIYVRVFLGKGLVGQRMVHFCVYMYILMDFLMKTIWFVNFSINKLCLIVNKQHSAES